MGISCNGEFALNLCLLYLVKQALGALYTCIVLLGNILVKQKESFFSAIIPIPYKGLITFDPYVGLIILTVNQI